MSNAASIHVDIKAGDGETVNLPNGDFVANASFTREGSDLYLSAPDGETIMIEGYFAQPTPPTLTTPDGARLSPDLVDAFLPPQYAGQYAQTTSTMADVSPAGQISQIVGEAHIIRADGTKVEAESGMPVFPGDVVETSATGAVNLVFVDNTTFAISESARLSVDEFTYSAAEQSGSSFFSMLQGVFVYTSGLIGKSDPASVNIETPVGSIGIRGTVVAGDIAPAGQESTVTLVDGAIVIINGAGTVEMNNSFDTIGLSSYEHPPVELPTMDSQSFTQSYGTLSDVSGGLFAQLDNYVPGQPGPNAPPRSAPQNNDPAPEQAPRQEPGQDPARAGDGAGPEQGGPRKEGPEARDAAPEGPQDGARGQEGPAADIAPDGPRADGNMIPNPLGDMLNGGADTAPQPPTPDTSFGNGNTLLDNPAAGNFGDNAPGTTGFDGSGGPRAGSDTTRGADDAAPPPPSGSDGGSTGANTAPPPQPVLPPNNGGGSGTGGSGGGAGAGGGAGGAGGGGTATINIGFTAAYTHGSLTTADDGLKAAILDVPNFLPPTLTIATPSITGIPAANLTWNLIGDPTNSYLGLDWAYLASRGAGDFSIATADMSLGPVGPITWDAASNSVVLNDYTIALETFNPGGYRFTLEASDATTGTLVATQNFVIQHENLPGVNDGNLNVMAGTLGNDNFLTNPIIDTTGNDLIYGFSGDDTIISHVGGEDLIYAGSGNDYVESPSNFALVDGGIGMDTFKLDAGDNSIGDFPDLSNTGVREVRNIEIIELGSDLVGNPWNVALSVGDVFEMTDYSNIDIINIGGTDFNTNKVLFIRPDSGNTNIMSGLSVVNDGASGTWGTLQTGLTIDQILLILGGDK